VEHRRTLSTYFSPLEENQSRCISRLTREFFPSGWQNKGTSKRRRRKSFCRRADGYRNLPAKRKRDFEKNGGRSNADKIYRTGKIYRQ
jgi:hypothetical protein